MLFVCFIRVCVWMCIIIFVPTILFTNNGWWYIYHHIRDIRGLIIIVIVIFARVLEQGLFFHLSTTYEDQKEGYVYIRISLLLVFFRRRNSAPCVSLIHDIHTHTLIIRQLLFCFFVFIVR